MRKRKLMLLVATMFVLSALKYALGQDDANLVGWDPSSFGYADPTQDILAIMICAPILGSFFGLIRVLTQRPLGNGRSIIQLGL